MAPESRIVLRTEVSEKRTSKTIERRRKSRKFGVSPLSRMDHYRDPTRNFSTGPFDQEVFVFTFSFLFLFSVYTSQTTKGPTFTRVVPTKV